MPGGDTFPDLRQVQRSVSCALLRLKFSDTVSGIFLGYKQPPNLSGLKQQRFIVYQSLAPCVHFGSEGPLIHDFLFRAWTLSPGKGMGQSDTGCYVAFYQEVTCAFPRSFHWPKQSISPCLISQGKGSVFLPHSGKARNRQCQ